MILVVIKCIHNLNIPLFMSPHISCLSRVSSLFFVHSYVGEQAGKVPDIAEGVCNGL